MTKYFLKHLGKNILQVVAMFGIMYSFIAVADKWVGVNPVWGVFAFLIFLLILSLTQKSWYDAKGEKCADEIGGKS